MTPRLLLLLPIAALALPLGGRADGIRSWTDRDGVVHFSNVRPGRPAARYLKGPEGSTRVVLEGRPTAASGGEAFRPRDDSSYDELLREACDRYRIPFALARAIVAAESNFDHRAVSRVGASGLMQLMPATAVMMYVDDIFDPRENILGGVRYLRVLTNEFEGDLVKVIAAYNAGPEAVKRAAGVPAFAETQAYVKRVLRLYEQYKERR